MQTTARPKRESRKKRGELTVFASYLSGAGKTCAMLRAAESERQAGRDVVVGLPLGGPWAETRLRATGLETLPGKAVRRQGTAVAELDLDACFRRRPQLVLVEDLAHRNADGARHRKRSQDIEELLKAGMDVYTTLDLPQVESIQDTVFSILGHTLPARVPDSVLDGAARVEFVDIEPARLRQRWQQQGRDSLLAAYSLPQLSALREIALRRCADCAALHTRGLQSREEYRTQEQILVCLSPSPANREIIRTAARMAGAFRCGLTALFVETKAFQRLGAAEKQQLEANIRLAQQLGASVETVYGEDVAFQIAEFSRLSGVTKIVLGRSGPARRPLLRRMPLTERLIELAPALDIHIIPHTAMCGQLAAGRREAMRMPAVTPADLVKSAFILLLSTLIGFSFYHLGFTDANIITIYILGVMLVAVSTKSPVCSFIASLVGVLTFNFFFTEPRFSLEAYESGYPVTFLIMFVASLLTGSLANQLKNHAKRSAQVAWRTKLLFETSQSLQKARTQEQALWITAQQLLRLFERDVVAYLAGAQGLSPPRVFLTEGSESGAAYTAESERQVAQWVLDNNKRAGAGTETLSGCRCTYLSVRTGDQVYGVVGLAAADKPLDSFETGILLSVLGECALALENLRNLAEKEAAAVLAKNEQLRANLLRSISHDLRTPLTSISGNASNLLSNGQLFDEKTKEQMYTDIYDDAMWLINLVENLLSVSRLEGGRMNLQRSTELIDEVVAEALRHVNRRSEAYRLRVQSSEEYLLAQIDARLIVQVLINIVDNAIKYTPPGSEIEIGWKRDGSFVRIWVADNGPGIPDAAKPRVFDMFYSASERIADSRRSMGLGLALCKSIVNAHGGEITVADHLPHGTIFTFTVPAGEVDLHE